jgi:hypothetical protein
VAQIDPIEDAFRPAHHEHLADAASPQETPAPPVRASVPDEELRISTFAEGALTHRDAEGDLLLIHHDDRERLSHTRLASGDALTETALNGARALHMALAGRYPFP